MKIILFFSVLFFFKEASYCQVGDKKVILSDSSGNGIEFSPFSAGENRGLIEPVNNLTGKGINTTFYLRDTSFWSFYTNAQNRLSIMGDGSIVTAGPLLINNASYDGRSSLRVNGQARFDTAVFIQASSLSDSNSFISIERDIKNHTDETDDKVSPYATTPTSWAAGKNIPVFRIRHPNSVSGNYNINTSLQRDFKIYPYQYGMTIDYNGVVECWVGEWSIHRGLSYYDMEGKGNGWGGVLWVGDDNDLGGIRATARNNTLSGGNINYGELSVEKFNSTPDGDFRFRLPSTENQFHFVYGGRGSENIVAKISDKGFIIPKGPASASVTAPEKGQIYFDSTATEFKGYDGNQWVSFSNSLITGSSTLSANGSDTVYIIEHDFGIKPAYFNVIATSPAAAGISYIIADEVSIKVFYNTAPAAGTNNLSYNWQMKK